MDLVYFIIKLSYKAIKTETKLTYIYIIFIVTMSHNIQQNKFHNDSVNDDDDQYEEEQYDELDDDMNDPSSHMAAHHNQPVEPSGMFDIIEKGDGHTRPM